MRRRNVKLFVGTLLALLVIGAVWLVHENRNKNESTEVKHASQSKKHSRTAELKFAAMGDMLAHDSINAQAKVSGGYDYAPYFSNIRPLYKDADVVFCNPETLSVGDTYGISGYPTFNAPNAFAKSLVKDAKCNLINLASNHQNDKGQQLIDANVGLWDRQSILAYAGSNRSIEEQNRIRYFTKNGIKVAFLAFAEYSNNADLTPYGVNMYRNTDLYARQLAEARKNADAVIVSLHWGTEDSNQVNDSQSDAAQLAAKAGADVILGTGPHVLQKVTWLQGVAGHKTLVWYSIGNMLSSQLKPNELTGVIAGFTLRKTKASKLEVSSLTAHITYMSYDWPSADKAAEKLEARSNFKLQSLQAARDRPAAMFGAPYSYDERLQYVRTVLGSDTNVRIIP